MVQTSLIPRAVRSKFPRSGLPDGIGAMLRARRMSAGLSSTALAKAIGVRRETLQRIERGDGQPSTRVVFAIAKLLDFEVKEVVPGWNEPADAELPCYGPRLRHRRRQLGLTLAEVAAAVAVKADLSPSMLSRFECEQSLPRQLVEVTRGRNGQIECRLFNDELAVVLGFEDADALEKYCTAPTLRDA